MKNFVLILVFGALLTLRSGLSQALETEPPVYRVALYADHPSRLSRAVADRLTRLGLKVPASSLSARQFEVLVPRSALEMIFADLEARLVLTHPTTLSKSAASSSSVRLVMQILPELPETQRAQFRLYQTSQHPDQDLQEWINTLIAKNLLNLTIGRPEIHSSEKQTFETKFSVRQVDLPRVADLAVERGPLELRPESPVSLNDEFVTVRFILQKNSTQSRPVESGKGWLTTVYVSAVQAPLSPSDLAHTLQAAGAAKATVTSPDFGSLIEGRPYFHFVIAEEKWFEILNFLSRGATVFIDRRHHVKRIPTGYRRILLETVDLLPPSLGAPTLQKLDELVPDGFTALPADDGTTESGVFLKGSTPAEVYENSLAIEGFHKSDVEVTSGSVDSDVMTGDAGHFRWDLQNLVRGETAKRKIRIRRQTTGSEVTSQATYAVYRGFRFSFSLGGGLIPSNTDFIYHGLVRASFWESPQFGLGVDEAMILKSSTTSNLKSIRTLSLRYRLNSGLQERAQSFIFGLSHQRFEATGTIRDSVGPSVGLSTMMPSFVNTLVDWIPFLDFPKRLDLEAAYYPVLIGSGGSASNWDVTIEPKIFFNAQFALFGRFRFVSSLYRFENTQVATNIFLGVGGAQLLF